MNIENTNRARGPWLNEVGLLPIGTMVLWMFCLVVGVLGQIIPYPARSLPGRSPPPPVQAEIMHVDLTKMISPAAVAPAGGAETIFAVEGNIPSRATLGSDSGSCAEPGAGVCGSGYRPGADCCRQSGDCHADCTSTDTCEFVRPGNFESTNTSDPRPGGRPPARSAISVRSDPSG